MKHVWYIICKSTDPDWGATHYWSKTHSWTTKAAKAMRYPTLAIARYAVVCHGLENTKMNAHIFATNSHAKRKVFPLTKRGKLSQYWQN
jgi:hypothetical protein